MVVSYYWKFIYIINIYISFWRVENMGLFVNNEHDIGQCRVIIIIIIIVIFTFLLLWNRELRFLAWLNINIMDSSKISLDRPYLILLQITIFRF